MATTNALLNVGRLNNFRLNAINPALQRIRRTKARFLLNGEDVRGRVRVHSTTIRDAINDSPNSASFTIEGPPSSAYAAAVLADYPVAYWRLGDTGMTAFDQAGHGHTGTVIGAVTINQPGAVSDGDRAMHFPGVVGARVEVAAAAELAFPSAVTVEVWIKTDGVQIAGIAERTVGGAVNTAWNLFQLNTVWNFRIVMGGTAYDVTVPVEPADVGTWVHLVCGWYDGAGAVWIYKNGVLGGITYGVPTGPLDGNLGPVLIGHLGSNVYPFTGTLDEVAIYRYPFDGNRIAAHYAAGRAVAAPTVAQEVRISIGVDDPTLLFNGALTQVDLSYEGRAHLPIYHCSATDDTLRANRRRPFGQWTNVTATEIARALIAAFVPGFGTTFVQAGLPPVTVIFDGSEGMNRCLTQITNLIGGYWYFNDRQLHLFLTEGTDAPDPIDAAHPFLADPRITAAVEMSQVRTRVFGRGHGEALLSAVVPGEALIPIASAVMFATLGGRAIALSQVLTYTGIYLGGIGSLVGPGAAPSVAALATLASGAGLVAGLYQYAYTFVTASGESLPGPVAAVSVGVLAPPTVGPSVGHPAMGTGPDPGGHNYAVTFVTASGETTPGPSVAVATEVSPAPETAPTLANATQGPGPDPGLHYYAVTFVIGTGGETTPGPVVAVQTGSGTQGVSPPAVAPVVTLGNRGAYNAAFASGYSMFVAVTFVTAAGETTAGPSGSVLIPGQQGGTYGATLELANIPLGPPGTVSRRLYSYPNSWTTGPPIQTVYRHLISDNTSTTWVLGGVDYTSGTQSSQSGQIGPPTNTAGSVTVPLCQLALANIPRGNANVSSRRLYRTKAGQTPFFLVATILNNTATTFTDTITDAALGAALPLVSTAHLQQFPVTVPKGPALVVARRIYRTRANVGGTLQLAGTINDNVTADWTDTVPDSALGVVAPVTNTATANQVQLSAIAVGASTVTARKVYRTPVDGAQLKLLATLANNSTLTYLDAATDAALGANVPTSDNSGLAQPQGQVNAGSTSLPTASAGPFLVSGGWALIGTQAIRYTGVAGNTLIGIPASGPGALIATVRFGDHILSAPMLTGVTVPGGALLAPVGTVIYLWIQRDDAAAQAAMARLDGGDGIYEYLVQDERRGEPSLTALCDAHLVAYKAPIQTITYGTRDLKTKSGKPVTIDLASPPILGTFVIQDVTIDQIDTTPGVAPRFLVTASTVRFSFEDLLRQLAGSLESA